MNDDEMRLHALKMAEHPHRSTEKVLDAADHYLCFLQGLPRPTPQPMPMPSPWRPEVVRLEHCANGGWTYMWSEVEAALNRVGYKAVPK